MPDIVESLWLGLAMRSESDQPHEWLPVGWVVRNRVERRGYPSTYRGVILQPWQFSYFNQFAGAGDDLAVFEQAKLGYAGESEGWSDNDFERAVECARWLMELPRWRAPFAPDVLHYYSPVSMRPPGSEPGWASRMSPVPVSGVDPWRFTFLGPRSRSA